MKRTVQMRLSDFDEPKTDAASSSSQSRNAERTESCTSTAPDQKRSKSQLWRKTVKEDEEWGVCNLDDTVVLVRLNNNRIHVYGEEVVCKWCGGILEIRDDKIFCTGACKRYQGDFSRDLNAFLWWEGVKSYTLRKTVAETEHLELEPRDREPISYVPNWSVLYEYEDESYAESDSLGNSEE